MFRHPLNPHSFEVLESRIAPAAVIDGTFVQGQVGSRILLSAGEGLSTGGNNGGAYMLFVEAGQCLVFTTDLNLNGQLDFNEITGISAGDGLSLISFANIHGDIVTNLKPNGFLSDSDNNAANNPPSLGGDGRVLLDSRIEKIELRSLTIADIRDVDGDGTVDNDDLATRFVLSSYSIFGNVYAGKGFGSTEGGLLIDTAGLEIQEEIFGDGDGNDVFIPGVVPSIGSIKIGTAGSGDYFSFGASRANDTQGFFVPFVPKPNVQGGDIVNIRGATSTVQFNIASLEAGDGGTGARGGNIVDVALFGDTAGGYRIIAGDGGRGPNGGEGGAIVNFSDAASVTSYVLLKSGDGGEGLTGVGGNGGPITLGTFNVLANLNILLGNGGVGFTAGGNGASFPKGVIVGPEGPDSYIGQVASSWHDYDGDAVNGVPGTLSSYASVDFDLDGNGDFVFTSVLPGQLVVQFGTAAGGFRTVTDANGVILYDRIYLDGFANSEALTLGDFNGDGNPDVATADFSPASFSGVRVFLSQYVDPDGDGIFDVFTGFSRGLDSALPALFNYNNNQPGARDRSAVAISDLTTGDFDGDGVTDIAVAATYSENHQFLVFLRGDAEDSGNGVVKGTGSFYADFGVKEDTTVNPPIPAAYQVPFFEVARPNPGTAELGVVKAFRLSVADTHDVVGYSIPGRAIDMVIFDASSGSAVGIAGIEVGNVDVDRDTGQRNLVRGNVKDFVPVDYDADGDIDLAILVDEPTGFMVTFTQGAPGAFTVFSGTDDNAGIRLGSNGLDRGETYAGIRVADANGDGLYNEVALLNLTFERIEQLSIREGTTAQNGALFVSALSTNVGDPGYSDTQYGFDLYPIPTGSVYGFGVNNTNLIQGGLASTSFGYSEFNEYQVVIAAGDGGSSLIGKGGVGGSLGGGLTGAVPDPLDPNAVDPTGTLTITFSPTIAFTGISTFVSGNGGNGFTTGGKGGSVTGLSVRDSGASNDDVVRVLAGNGGFGVSGAGGAGGDIKENSIQRAIEIVAGNGGSGKTGGDGGSVIGNGIRKAYDAESPSLEIVAGAGGDGVKKGGLGGSITNYVYRLTVLITGAVTGPLSLIAGAGGSAISGRGGNGGSINNSSPMDDDNGLAAEMFLQAGDGGNGVAGGHGGSITNFVNRPTTPDAPTIVSFIAGHGGSGTSGKGGNGGTLTNISTPSTGDPSSILGERITDFTYNRYLAGNGGGSSSNAGGKGGNVVGLNVSASSGAMAVIAGAGGEGLLAGGSGGSVLDSVVSSGGPEAGGKVLVIAGAGGHATAFTENSNDDGGLNNGAKAFGGKIGKGGNGGSIVGFIQENSIDVSVDLIAGNGGDTLNYGTRRDSKTFVGQGGSIKNINLNGSVGTVDPTRAIKAYNDTDGDGINDKTLAEWVQDYIRVPVDDDGNPIIPTGIGDGVGNVGIVAGAAGRIKAIAVEGGGFETQPAPGAGKLTGTVQNLTARLLMSAIAGDVNSIAAIHVAKNINILSGLVGADKGVFGTVEYYDLDDNIVSTPVLGGRLLDGAFISDNRVPEIDGKPRVFVL